MTEGEERTTVKEMEVFIKEREITNRHISVMTQLIDRANEYYRNKYNQSRGVSYDLADGNIISTHKYQNATLWWTFTSGKNEDINENGYYFLVWGTNTDNFRKGVDTKALFLFKGTPSMFHSHATKETLDEWEELIMRSV